MKTPYFKGIFSNNIRIIKYLFSGISAFFTEYLTFLFFLYILNLNLTIANILSFCLGFIVSFTLNRNWVFKEFAKHKDPRPQLIKYLSLAMVNVLISSLLINLTSILVAAFIAKVLTVIIIAIWNYIIFKKYIFK